MIDHDCSPSTEVNSHLLRRGFPSHGMHEAKN